MSAMRGWLKRGSVVLVIVFCFVLPGCVDYDEINQLAIVSLIGVDETDQGKKIVYYQIVNPTGLSVSQKGGGIKAPVYNYRIEGNSWAELTVLALKTLPRKLFAQHYQGYVVSERLARKGLREIINFLDANPDRRMATNVYISRRPLTEFMNSYITLERMPGRAMRSTQRIAEADAGLTEKHTRLNDLAKHLETSEPTFITLFDFNEPAMKTTDGFEYIIGNAGNYVVSGCAIFKRDRMIGSLNSKEATMNYLLHGAVDNPILSVLMPGREKVELQIVSSPKIKKRYHWRGQNPELSLHMKMNLSLITNNQETKLTVSNLSMIESRFDATLKKELDALLAKARQNDWDLLGIERDMDLRSGSQWMKRRNEHDGWKKTKVTIKVTSRVTKVGALKNPYTKDHTHGAD